MKLNRPYAMYQKNMSIAAAVENDCNGEADGQLESLKDGQGNMATLLGKLVQRLHANGVLSDDAVLEILNSSWEKSE